VHVRSYSNEMRDILFTLRFTYFLLAYTSEREPNLFEESVIFGV